MPSSKKLVKQRSGKFAICQELTVELQPVATRAGAQLIRHGSGISAALKYARPPASDPDLRNDWSTGHVGLFCGSEELIAGVRLHR